MKIKSGSYFLIFMLLLMAYVVGASLTFPFFEDKLLFLLMGGIILLLGAVQLTRELRARNKTLKTTKGGTGETDAGRLERRQTISALGWTVGFFLGTYLLGFLVASALVIAGYLRLHGSSRVRAVSTAIITIAILYVMFQFGLKAEIYRGVLFSWLF